MLPLLGVLGGASVMPGWELRSHRLCCVTKEKKQTRKKANTPNYLPAAKGRLYVGQRALEQTLEHRPLFGCRKASSAFVHVTEKHNQGLRVGPHVKETDLQVSTALAF